MDKNLLSNVVSLLRLLFVSILFLLLVIDIVALSNTGKL